MSKDKDTASKDKVTRSGSKEQEKKKEKDKKNATPAKKDATKKAASRKATSRTATATGSKKAAASEKDKQIPGTQQPTRKYDPHSPTLAVPSGPQSSGVRKLCTANPTATHCR